MSETNDHTCWTCGATWPHGWKDSHICTEILNMTVIKLRSELAAYKQAAEVEAQAGDEARAEAAKLREAVAAQPLYRRHKAEWVRGSSSEVFEWQGYRAGFLLGSWTGSTVRLDRWINFGLFATLELAQAACEEHFWSELEASVLERVS